MSERDMSAFIGHVVMAMRFVADFIDGMTLMISLPTGRRVTRSSGI